MPVPAPERRTLTVAVVSLVLATGTPLAWNMLTPPANAGTQPIPVVTATPVPVIEPAEMQQDIAASEAQTTTVARSARIGDLDVTPSPTPRRLQIPSLQVNAAIGAIGVEKNGDMEIPEDVRDVGWYRHGPAPGEPGAAVIAGHVDSREQGAGAFFDLRRLDVGARIKVIDGNGDVQRYDVVARRTYDKTVLPTDDLFARQGPSQLVLITCGGDFDSTAGSYRQNVVIYAQPVSSSA